MLLPATPLVLLKAGAQGISIALLISRLIAPYNCTFQTGSTTLLYANPCPKNRSGWLGRTRVQYQAPFEWHW